MYRVGTYSDGRQVVVLSCWSLNSHLQLVCIWYFGIFESRIPLTVHITASMCFIVEFVLCRWISFPVVISLILIQCFPKVFLSVKVLVDRVGLLSAWHWRMIRAWMWLGVFAIVSMQTSSLTAMACRWIMIVLLYRSLSRWWRTKSRRNRCSQWERGTSIGCS